LAKTTSIDEKVLNLPENFTKKPMEHLLTKVYRLLKAIHSKRREKERFIK
jgi:hypothetical protein